MYPKRASQEPDTPPSDLSPPNRLGASIANILLCVIGSLYAISSFILIETIASTGAMQTACSKVA